MKKRLFIIVCCLFSGLSFAKSHPQHMTTSNRWHFLPSIGFNYYSNMSHNDGSMIVKRLALAKDIKITRIGLLGVEIGAQDGHQARPHFTDAQLNPIGGVPVLATIDSSFDALATLTRPISSQYPLLFVLKGGAVYRQMHTDRDNLNDLWRIQPELQIGLLTPIAANTKLGIHYQSIFANRLKLSTTGADGQGSGHMNTIPATNGILITLDMIFS